MPASVMPVESSSRFSSSGSPDEKRLRTLLVERRSMRVRTSVRRFVNVEMIWTAAPVGPNPPPPPPLELLLLPFPPFIALDEKLHDRLDAVSDWAGPVKRALSPPFELLAPLGVLRRATGGFRSPLGLLFPVESVLLLPLPLPLCGLPSLASPEPLPLEATPSSDPWSEPVDPPESAGLLPGKRGEKILRCLRLGATFCGCWTRGCGCGRGSLGKIAGPWARGPSEEEGNRCWCIARLSRLSSSLWSWNRPVRGGRTRRLFGLTPWL
mmetsp:Transcript_18089/g.44362  ORF Transcript_18089/g.44362 Transcript_18089/m.44362 type:complete len:267 (+) Transcript_18089:1416-2216(+)